MINKLVILISFLVLGLFTQAKVLKTSFSPNQSQGNEIRNQLFVIDSFGNNYSFIELKKGEYLNLKSGTFKNPYSYQLSFIIKTDIRGNILWTVPFENSKNFYNTYSAFSGIVLKKNGNILISGSTTFGYSMNKSLTNKLVFRNKTLIMDSSVNHSIVSHFILEISPNKDLVNTIFFGGGVNPTKYIYQQFYFNCTMILDTFDNVYVQGHFYGLGKFGSLFLNGKDSNCLYRFVGKLGKDLKFKHVDAWKSNLAPILRLSALLIDKNQNLHVCFDVKDSIVDFKRKNIYKPKNQKKQVVFLQFDTNLNLILFEHPDPYFNKLTFKPVSSIAFGNHIFRKYVFDDTFFLGPIINQSTKYYFSSGIAAYDNNEGYNGNFIAWIDTATKITISGYSNSLYVGGLHSYKDSSLISATNFFKVSSFTDSIITSNDTKFGDAFFVDQDTNMNINRIYNLASDTQDYVSYIKSFKKQLLFLGCTGKKFMFEEDSFKQNFNYFMGRYGDGKDSFLVKTNKSFKNNFCFGDSIRISANATHTDNYQWYKNDSQLYLKNDSFLYVKDSGIYYCQIIDRNGCYSVSDTQRFFLKKGYVPILNYSGKKIFCSPDSLRISFKMDKYSNFSWFNTRNLISRVGKDSILTVKSSGRFLIVTTNIISGCKNSQLTDSIVVYPKPAKLSLLLDSNTRAPICNNQIRNLTSSFISKDYKFSFYIDSVKIQDSTFPLINISKTGIYKLKIYNNYCSQIAKDTFIQLLKAPLAEWSPIPADSICNGVKVFGGVKGGLKYQWLVNGQISKVTTNKIDILYPQTIQAIAIDSNGCMDSTPIHIVFQRKLLGKKPILKSLSDSIGSDLSFGIKWYYKERDSTIPNFRNYIKTKLDGLYAAYYFDNNACLISSDTLFFKYSSLKKFDQLPARILIYPNPSSGIYHIKNNFGGKILGVLYNSLGQAIISDIELTQGQERDLDISQYPNGMYFFKSNGFDVKLLKE